MWNVPDKERLSGIPRLYETESVRLKEKRIHLHFFIGGCDWYAVEFDGEDIFFGFVNLNDDLNAEWGYFSFEELREINIGGLEVDCEKEEYWGCPKVSKVPGIRTFNASPCKRQTSC